MRGSTGPPDGEAPQASLEQLRRSGFLIDREGEFRHDGAAVRHEGLRQALFRWLDVHPDGRTILRLDRDRFAYVDVDDTPLVVRAARVHDGAILLSLSDGAEEMLNPATLDIAADGILRCAAREGRLPARLSTSAAAVVADLIEDRPEGPTLVLPAAAFRLRPHPRTPHPT